MSLALLWMLQLGAVPAVAAPPPPRYRLGVDLPLTLIAGGAWAGLYRDAPSLARPSCPCARAELPPFDRFAVDAHFAQGGTVASATLGLSLMATAVALAGAAPDARSAAEDVGLASEAAAFAGLATELAKIGFSRPYPYMYRSSADAYQARSGINYAAMWSGHTAVPMAASVAGARILDWRGAPRPLRIAAWIAGPLLAVASGALEVSASNHFPSDVVVGATAGAAIGWGVVELHLP